LLLLAIIEITPFEVVIENRIASPFDLSSACKAASNSPGRKGLGNTGKMIGGL
jgi:hypothetical protein